ncbi:MAG: secretin N-terminal domain-containing protein [Verrucomicrobiota bacterium]
MIKRGIITAGVGLLLTVYPHSAVAQTSDQATQLNEIQQKTRSSAADALRRAREVAGKVKANQEAGLAESAALDPANPVTEPTPPGADPVAAPPQPKVVPIAAPLADQGSKAVPPLAPAVPAEPIAIPAEADPAEVKTPADDISIQPLEPIYKGIDLEQSNVDEELITIELDDVALKDVVRMFSRISGANIIASEQLEGHRVTVSLQDVEWEIAMDAILDQSGFIMVEKHRGIYTVISKSALAAEPVEVETIILNYITVSNALPVVRQMLVSTNSSVTPLVAANALILRETAQQILEIKEVLAIIDKPRPQVFIEAKFVELNDQAINNIGVNWEVLQGYTISANSLGKDYTDTRRRVEQNSKVSFIQREISDERETIDNGLNSTGNGTTFNASESINRSISNIGTPLESTSAAGSGSETRTSTGNTANSNSRNTINGRIRNTTVVDAVLSGLNFDQATVSGDTVNITPSTPRDRIDIRSAILSAEAFALTLSALKEMDGVQIVSNPKLLVANGERATIHVGRNEPNIEAVPQGDTGDRFAYRLNSTQPFIEIGVKLSVTPTINTTDSVTLRISPELSRLLGEKTVGEANTSFPITQIRKIETEFNVESGKTVAIGGLTETSDNEVIKKVPILGDIPIIGKYLFTHTHTEQFQDEVVIFVTVVLADPPDIEEYSGVPEGSRLIYQWLDKQEKKGVESKADRVDDRTVDEILADLRRENN